MKIAVYRLPFQDFDYVKLATDCGVKTAVKVAGDVSGVDSLVAVAPQAVIDTLSANLDFGPETIQDIDLAGVR